MKLGAAGPTEIEYLRTCLRVNVSLQIFEGAAEDASEIFIVLVVAAACAIQSSIIKQFGF